MIDFHSHLVPAVDDGVQSLDHAREALAAMRDAGVRTLVTTPHFDASLTHRPDAMRARLDEIDAAWDRLAELAREEFPDLELDRGVELRIDIPRPDLSDPRLRLAGTRAVLVEFDAFSIPINADGVLAAIADDGWTPVLAHPERYREASVDRLRPLADIALLQLNDGSLTGRYGGRVRTLAWQLLDHGLITVTGSDYHGYQETDVAPARAAVEDRMGEEAARLLFGVNGRRILDGEQTVPVRAPDRRHGLLDRIRGLLKR